MSSARDLIGMVADQIEEKAVEAHIEGIALLRRAAKLEQLSEIMTERQAELCLNNLVTSGLVRVVAGKATLCENWDSAAVEVACTSAGGKA